MLVVTKQLPVDEASRRNLAKIRKGIFSDTANALAEDLYTGKITIGGWQEAMKKAIRELHTAMAAIGRGDWASMTPSDWGRVGATLKEQYRYLQSFAEFIFDNSDTISLAAIQSRARLYGEASGYSSEVAQADASIIDALPWIPKDGSTECLVGCHCYWRLDVISSTKTMQTVDASWHLQPAEHCDDCVGRHNYRTTIHVPVGIDVPPIIGGW